MPYRRLPTTDQARKRAMAQALEMGETKLPENLAFSQKTFDRLKSFSPEFENALINYKSNLEYQVNKNKDYGETVKKARLYISHFIQVLNLAITREELTPEDREYYGLKKNENVVPPLNLEIEIHNWGKKIIEGEQNRINNGGNPIYSPSIALVKVHFESFLEAYHLQKTFQANTLRSLAQIAEMRNTADVLIRGLWNEIELHYQFLSPKNKRQKAKDYGVVYIYRKNEGKNANQEELQTDLVFEM